MSDSTRLWLTEAQAKTIVQQAIDEAPREACGVIGGIGERAERTVALTNVASDPHHFYQLDTKALDQAVRAFRADGLSLIGIYHAHPKGDPIPSPTDVKNAPHLAVSHLIVGLRHSTPHLAAWRIHHGQVERVELHIGASAPDVRNSSPLSQAQKTAIILSALIAVLLVLVISLSLLPPAPVIVTATPSLP
jgi:proteasome lid subunit RPN8/RPN11